MALEMWWGRVAIRNVVQIERSGKGLNGMDEGFGFSVGNVTCRKENGKGEELVGSVLHVLTLTCIL